MHVVVVPNRRALKHFSGTYNILPVGTRDTKVNAEFVFVPQQHYGGREAAAAS